MRHRDSCQSRSFTGHPPAQVLSFHRATRDIPTGAPLLQRARTGLGRSTWVWGVLTLVLGQEKPLCSAGEEGWVQADMPSCAGAPSSPGLCRDGVEVGAVTGKPLICAALLGGQVGLERMSGLSAPSPSPVGL